ncbi:hypothetical protein GGI35DRAFT_91693 [Trichoderma velutinum]
MMRFCGFFWLLGVCFKVSLLFHSSLDFTLTFFSLILQSMRHHAHFNNNHAAFCSHRIRPHIISGLLRILFTLGFPASDLRSLLCV